MKNVLFLLMFPVLCFGQTAEEYENRGISKDDLKDYEGAIADFTKAIELDPDFATYYSNRGKDKIILKDYTGAIADYTKAIELNPSNATYYSNRGLAKYRLNQNECPDFKKACELGNCENYNKGCK